MVSWTRRSRRKPPRRKARFHVEGMTAAQLGAKVGVSARTVRFYMAERVLPSPEFRGAATRYGREHLACLAAIRGLQRERRMSLPAIRQYLRDTNREEVERVAAGFLPELAPAGGSRDGAAGVAAAVPNSGVAAVTDTWHRLTISPGLEIHLHLTASAEVQALARGLVERLRAIG
jgi:DNA-binding transcriptional MerR regulator